MKLKILLILLLCVIAKGEVVNVYTGDSNDPNSPGWYDLNNWSQGYLPDGTHPDSQYDYVEIRSNCNMPEDAILVGLGLRLCQVQGNQFNAAGFINVHYNIEIGNYGNPEADGLYILPSGNVICDKTVTTDWDTRTVWIFGEYCPRLRVIDPDDRIRFVCEDNGKIAGKSADQCDFNNDGVINLKDLAIFADKWCN